MQRRSTWPITKAMTIDARGFAGGVLNDSCANGVKVAPAVRGTAAVTITNSGTALSVAGTSAAWLTRSVDRDHAHRLARRQDGRHGAGHRGEGRERIHPNGRIGTARASAGAYRMTVRALGADGQTDETTVALTLRRR